MKDSSSRVPVIVGGPSIIGRSLPRLDVIEKAMGEARYSNDVIDQDAMALALVGSPRAHIRIHRLDISEALQVPGVVRVLTAHDIPGKNRLPWGNQPFLVEGEARFLGEPIALVVAEHPNDALEGARLVHVDYEELPDNETIEASLAEDAPEITTGPDGPNIWHSISREQGDVEDAFSHCEQVIQREFLTSSQAAASLDPVGLTAKPASDGGIHIAGAIQAPFAVQAAVANVLDLPHHRIYVAQRTLGGEAGSKAESAALFGGYTALAAWLTGCPVRLVLTQEEERRLSVCRTPAMIQLKYGCSREGELQACELTFRIQAGAYPGFVEMALQRAIAHAPGPYNIPHIRVKAEAVATHTTPFGLLPGYGQMPLSFAQECLIDELAQKLSLDPIALRRNNLLDPNTPLPWCKEPDSTIQLHRALDEVLAASGWHHKRDAYDAQGKRGTSSGHDEPEERPSSKTKRRGIGIALGFSGLTSGNESKMPPQATVSIRLQGDGSVQVSAPQAKTGRGVRTCLAQVVAERLSIPYNSVHLLESDTLHSSSHAHTVFSPGALVTGLALLEAATPLRNQLLDVVAKHFAVSTNDIRMSPGQFFSPNDTALTTAEAVELCWQAGLPTEAYGHVALPTDEEYPAPTYPAYAYSAHVAEIEIDIETFDVTVLNLYVACDLGKAINPNQARSQIEGKAIFGLGYALMEQLKYLGTDGEGNALPYPLPSIGDIPQLHPLLIESPFDPGPYASKGAGDLAAIGTTPAILNAIAQALGERLYQLPATPERLFSTSRRQS